VKAADVSGFFRRRSPKKSDCPGQRCAVTMTLMTGPAATPDATFGQPASTRLSRPIEGRRLAGVCAVAAETTHVRVGWVRAAFVFGVLLAGLTLVVYLAGWLILPSEGAEGELGASRVSAAIVGLVLLCGGVLAVATLALASAAATVFGFGWGVVIVGVGVLVGGGFWLRQMHPGWLLVPILALVAPSAAITAAHIRVSGHVGDVTVAPARSTQLAGARYSIGLGTLLVDLRTSTWPASGAVTLHIRGDLGRTIIALPTNRCIGVKISYDVHSSLLHGLVDDFETENASPLTAFGTTPGSYTGTFAAFAQSRHHPVLQVDFTSQGGALTVRDYPGTLSPPDDTGWPGTRLPLPARPDITGQGSGVTKTELSGWRASVRDQRRVDALLPGPCAKAAHS
jgi:phage shock protein PspC (stress-responsive transcriptional regulator)